MAVDHEFARQQRRGQGPGAAAEGCSGQAIRPVGEEARRLAIVGDDEPARVDPVTVIEWDAVTCVY